MLFHPDCKLPAARTWRLWKGTPAPGTLLTGSQAVDAVFFPPNYRTADSLLRQREDRAGRGDAAQYVLAKRDQRRCGLGSDRA